MKKSILKNNLREILKTRRRFLSILVMAFLGVGFFAGLRACGPDMAETLDRYADENKLYDISIVSTLGMTDDDVEAIKKIDGIEDAYGIKSINSVAKMDDEEQICKVIEYSEEINKPYIIYGRAPENNKECLLDAGQSWSNEGEEHIGKKIVLEYDEKNKDDEDNIVSKEFTVVGIAYSPEYISFERGNASIGTGKIDFFMYVSKDVFNFDYYVNTYVAVSGTKELLTTTDEYNDKTNEVSKNIEGIKEKREKIRYDNLVNEANEKLEDAQKKLDEKKIEADNQISDAQKKIDDAKKEIKNAEIKIKNAENELKTQKEDINGKIKEAQDKLSSYETEISNKKSELESGQNELNQKKTEVNSIVSQIDVGLAEIESNLKALKDSKKQIETGNGSLGTINSALEELNTNLVGLNSQKEILESTIPTLETQIAETPEEDADTLADLQGKLEEARNNLNSVNSNIETINSKITELNTQKEAVTKGNESLGEIDKSIKLLEDKKTELSSQKNEAVKGINDAQAQIDNGRAQLSSAEVEINNQKNILNDNINNANNEFSNAEKKIREGKADLIKGKNELAENEAKFITEKEDANKKLADAQKELDDAKDDVSKIEKAKWYISERKTNSGYSNIKDAIQTMDNIAQSFPVIFYAIAVLVSLTSMTRMIEEERQEIGTLKAIGYSNIQIIGKYVMYVMLACTIGGVIGMMVGFNLLPNMVWDMYKTLYTVPKFFAPNRFEYGLLGLIIEIACILGATIFVAIRELKDVPASLMRPKPPKNGKSILLEKIGFIWKHMNFSQKVIARNIFRYKKRGLITIIGIAGCTALMVTGFGIRDSIRDITGAQYTNSDAIFTYNLMANTSNNDDSEKINELLNKENNIESYSNIMANSAQAVGEKKNYDVNIFAIDNKEDFYKQCNLVDKDGEKIELNNDGIIITSKLAKFLNISIGDKANIIDSDDISHEFSIIGIAENYVSHYIYMTRDFYEKNIKTYKPNTILVSLKNTNEEEVHNLSEKLLEYDSVSAVQEISVQVSLVDDMLKTVDMVVVILVISSALLDFVVLYNLANINIGERQREIATLKVLGFYDKEVDDYINKENIIYTIIGIAIGLVLGYFITNMIVASVEVDSIRFIRYILPISYVYSAVCTFAFSIIVNLIIHIILKKIDMIDSLKSVE